MEIKIEMYYIMTDQIEPTYDEILVEANQPTPQPLTSIDKKRANKTVSCPICDKVMNKKTLKYSHNCQRTKEEPKEQAQPQITDEQIQIYLQNKHLEHREQQNSIRQDKFNKLIKNMV